MGLPSTKEKKLKPQNVGPTHLSLVIFQCGIVSHKRKKNPKPQNLGSTIFLSGVTFRVFLSYFVSTFKIKTKISDDSKPLSKNGFF